MNVPRNMADAPQDAEVPSPLAPALPSPPVRVVGILENITDAFFSLDPEWRFTYLNAQAVRLLSRTRAELLGKDIWDEFPEAVGSPFEAEYRRAVAEARAVSFEQFYPPLNTWFDVRAYPSPKGLSVFFQDITERIERRRRARFLADLADRTRGMTDPDAVIADAVRSTGEFLGASRCMFADIDIAADTCTVAFDYCIDDSVPGMADVYPISAFGAPVVSAFAAGQAVVVDDVHHDPAQAPPDSLAAYEAAGIRAHATVPVVHSARTISLISCHSAVPRRWTPEEVELIQTVVERTWLNVKVMRQKQTLRREAQELRDAHERTYNILESIADGFYVIDRDWRFRYINAQGERMLQCRREDVIGRAIWDAFPEAVGGTFYSVYRQAMDDGKFVSVEDYYAPLDSWMDVRIYPSADGLSVFFQNVNERRRSEEVLRQSEERYRLLVEGARDYAMILMDTAGCITTWNRGAERILGWTEGEVHGQTADLIFTPEDRAAGVPTREMAAAAAEGKALDLRWHLKKDGSRFYADGVLERLRDEAGRLRGFAKILRDATERKSLEDERERLLDANRLLLDSTGEGIYGIDLEGCFTFVNRAAARLLGFTPEQVLGQSGHGLIHHTRPDGTPYPEQECPIYQALRCGNGAHVEDDVFWRADGTSFPVSYTAAPILEHGTVRGAVVTFSDIRERKALERERERLAERERNIATQLQTALTPAIPDRIPGMALAKYYEAALDEAGVGGDFYDVFLLDKGCTALVVGDLSGKGLAAARQVAAVRNMLRFAMHHAPTLAEALNNLNEILVEQGLLTGFATLFVGAYDCTQGTLTYVNAGQEPALLRRAATGQVEELSSTGCILGAFGSTSYEEQTVLLAAGDALAIFTDGVTECGPSRREMLGVEGVTALLGVPLPPEETASGAQTAETLALRLVEGVDDASRGGVAKDDVCLLIAVAEDAFPGQ